MVPKVVSLSLCLCLSLSLPVYILSIVGVCMNSIVYELKCFTNMNSTVYDLSVPAS